MQTDMFESIAALLYSISPCASSLAAKMLQLSAMRFISWFASMPDDAYVIKLLSHPTAFESTLMLTFANKGKDSTFEFMISFILC